MFLFIQCAERAVRTMMIIVISTHIKCEKCFHFRDIVSWDTDLSSFVEDVEVRK